MMTDSATPGSEFPAPSSESPAPSSESPAPCPKILLVDDERSIRITLSEFLRDTDYEVKVAEDADQAMNMLAEEDFDVVVTDIVMPRVTGVKLLKAIRESAPRVQVILMTGEPTVETASKAVRADAFDYLTKPVSKGELVRTVTNAVMVKTLDDERRRLAKENLRYQENLEQLVGERTKELQESEEKYRILFTQIADPIFIFDKETLYFLNCNHSALERYGYTLEELYSMTPDQLHPPEDRSGVKENITDEENISPNRYTHVTKEGEVIQVEIHTAPIEYEEQEAWISIVRDVTERVRAEAEIRRRNRELALLNRVIAAASMSLEPKAVLEITCRELAKAFDLPQAAAALLNEERTASTVVAEYLTEGHSSALDVVIPIESNFATQYVLEQKAPLAIVDAQHDPRMTAMHDPMRHRGTVSMLLLPLIAHGQVVGTLGLDAVEQREFTSEDIDLAASAAAAAAQALENARLYQAEQRRRLEAELLREAAQMVSTSLEISEVLRLILTQLKRILIYTTASVLIMREDNIPNLVVGSGYTDEEQTSLEAKDLLRSSPILRQMARDLQPVISADVQELEGWTWVPGAEHVRSWMCIPMVARGQMIGALMVDSTQPDFFSKADMQLTQSLAQLAAQALENARLFNQANRQLKRMETIHAIDKVISSSVDIDLTVGMFLEQSLIHLEVDAADVLLFDPFLQTLECIGRKGFKTSALEHTHLHLGQGLAGQVALEREIKHIPDLGEEEEVFLASPKLSQENFFSYYGIPLVAKGVLKGVLEIFHRAPLSPDDEWLRFLNTLAGQAAIAIDNAIMFTDLQRSNLKLGMAYNSTLEGWAKALELKDMETEGHSRRVLNLTMKLADQMMVSRQELIHIRRGALLHDIGKMGVPDSILLKPGALTDEEWSIMRQHPVYARDMLAPIEYLRPALDIPYSHHEKWDGSGYPEGLRGEQIPLAARIFSIVDVWDALRSVRPYREAWPEEKALAYIREQSGTHFDPQVVEAFFKLMPKASSD